MSDSHRHTQRLAVMGRIAVGVAHDLNNLLTVVLACSDSLLLDMEPSDPRAEEVGDIGRAARVGASLTRRLLTIGRKRSTGPSVVRPAVVVAECDALLRRLVGPSVRLTVHVAPDAGAVLADVGELEQVIMNLAANGRARRGRRFARRAMRRSRRRYGCVRISDAPWSPLLTPCDVTKP